MSRQSQKGFNLIELMVAMTIGLFILGGLSAVFVNLKQAFNTQSALSQLQDNERLALTMLKTAVEQAGYFYDHSLNTFTSEFHSSTGTYTTFSDGQIVAGLTSGGNDAITVRFINQSGNGMFNCLGQTNNSGFDVVITETFAINSSNELACSLNNGLTWTSITGSVSAMSIAYGVDLSGNGVIDSYRTAAQVGSSSAWTNVKSVKFQLSMINPFANVQGGNTSAIIWTQIVKLMNTS